MGTSSDGNNFAVTITNSNGDSYSNQYTLPASLQIQSGKRVVAYAPMIASSSPNGALLDGIQIAAHTCMHIMRTGLLISTIGGMIMAAGGYSLVFSGGAMTPIAAAAALVGGAGVLIGGAFVVAGVISGCA